MAPHRSDSMEAQDNVRKRVCKACDRCRLKKSKCDGSSPCSRCKADNAICVFGERKKLQDKVYPKGYVEMLEQQQTQLVAGLRELYSLLQKGESWPGQPLREGSSGHPLTHDILERLDLLRSSDGSSNYDGFEEDCNRMQQRLLDGGAPFTRRRGSVSSDSDHGHTSSSSHHSTPTTTSFAFDNSYVRNNAPPTPPTPSMNSPFLKMSQMVPPVKQEKSIASPTFMNPVTFDSSTLPRTWANDCAMIDESVDFIKPMYAYDDYNYDQSMMVDSIAINPSDPMMPHWSSSNDLDFNNFVHNIVGP